MAEQFFIINGSTSKGVNSLSQDNYLTVNDVLKTPHFKKAVLLAGAKGLNRPVKWVHILEAREFISESLNGEELVLTTGVGFTGKDSAVRFLSELIGKNVSGLCIELVSYVTKVPEEMIALAQANDFPLIGFPEFTRYVDITRFLYGMIINRSGGKPTPAEGYDESANQIWVGQWLKGGLPEEDIRRHLKDNLSGSSSAFAACILETEKEHLPLISAARQFSVHHGFSLLVSDDTSRLILCDRGSGDDNGKRLNAAAEELAEYTDGINRDGTIFWGIGQPVHRPLQIVHSLETAADAIAIQKRVKLQQPLYENLHIYRIVARLEREGSLRGFVVNYLQPLIDYDQRNQGELLKTLKIFYQCSGSKQQTAERLFIARQTLYFRLQKIADLIGEDFLEPEKRLAVEFAICGYEYLKGV